MLQLLVEILVKSDYLLNQKERLKCSKFDYNVIENN